MLRGLRRRRAPETRAQKQAQPRPQTRPERRFGLQAGDLPERTDPDATVVVLAPTPALARRALSRTGWAGAPRVVLSGGLEEMHAAMSRLPRVDLVVDLHSSWGSQQLQAWRRLYSHLAAGGSWVAVRTKPIAGREEQLAQRHGVARGSVVVVKARQHLLKVRHETAAALLTAREPGLAVTVVERHEGGLLANPGRAVHHAGTPVSPFPEEIPYPPSESRRYEGPVRMFTGAYAVHGRSVLPESFRWHLTAHPVNSALLDAGPRFAAIRPRVDQHAPRRLEGSYYNLDYGNPGHYGHLLTEGFTRLWGWHAAKAADPDLKLLLRLHRNRPQSPQTRAESILLPAFGIDPADVVWIQDDVEVTSLVGTTPLWHNSEPYYANPAIRDNWARVRTSLLDRPDAVSAGSDCIFVSRREGQRPVHNVDEVERFFADAGFTIVLPGRLTLPEQAATFAGARVVAGFGGTGMFNILFCERLETMVVLNQSAYQARNEELYAAVHGADSHFFYSNPDLEHPPGGYSYAAHQSPWSFDFERNGAELRTLLDSLVT